MVEERFIFFLLNLFFVFILCIYLLGMSVLKFFNSLFIRFDDRFGVGGGLDFVVDFLDFFRVDFTSFVSLYLILFLLSLSFLGCM